MVLYPSKAIATLLFKFDLRILDDKLSVQFLMSSRLFTFIFTQGIFLIGSLQPKCEIVLPDISNEKLPAPITVALIEFSALSQFAFL